MKLILLVLVTAFTVSLPAQTTSDPALLPQRDGAHDFDFLIGDWTAHVRRLPDRLNNSNVWVEYDGISNHHKILDSNSNCSCGSRPCQVPKLRSDRPRACGE